MDIYEKLMIQKLMDWSHGKRQPPLLATFRVTNLCDMNCVFCGNDHKQSKDELTIHDYTRIFKELNNLGVKLCALVGGGEIMCKKKLTFDLFKLMKKYNMRGWAVTNGLNLNENDLKYLAKYGPDTLLFSLDAPYMQLHDELRKKNGSFNKILKNIITLNKYINNNKKIKIQMLVLNKNYREIKKMVDLCESLGIKELILNYLIIRSNMSYPKQYDLNTIQSRMLRKELNKLIDNSLYARKHTNFSEFIQILTLREKDFLYKKPRNQQLIYSYCYQPWLHFNVSEHGYINHCPELNNVFKHDNLLKKKTDEIWYGEKFNRFRRLLLKGNLLNMCHMSCAFPILINNIKIRELLGKYVV
jgi:MoaA/NifB/PqqE/SkfB family radical SAM enzyme